MGKKEGSKMGDLLLNSVLQSQGLPPPKQPSTKRQKSEDEKEEKASTVASVEKESNPWVQLILLHFGLVGLCVVYILGGAAIFYFLERPGELQQRKEGLARLAASKSSLMDELWTIQHRPDLDEEGSKDASREALDAHIKLIWETQQNDYVAAGLDHKGNPLDEFESVWSVQSSIMLAITIVTTIGYGYVVPQTAMGRAFCIMFGMLGIPLTLVTIADLARFLGLGVVTGLIKTGRLIRRIKSRLRGQPPPKKVSRDDELDEDDASVPMSVTLLILISYPVIGSGYFMYCRPEWTFLDAFHFSLASVLTIGYGDLYLENDLISFLPLVFFLISGVTIVTMCVDLVGSEWIEQIHFLGRNIGKAKLLANKMRSGFGGLGAMMQSMSAAQRQLLIGAALGNEDGEPVAFAPANWEEFKFAEVRRSLLPSSTSTYDTFDSVPIV